MARGKRATLADLARALRAITVFLPGLAVAGQPPPTPLPGVAIPEELEQGVPEGGGGYTSSRDVACVTAEDRVRIRAAIDRNVAILIARGQLLPVFRSEQVTYGWPLRASASLNVPGVHALSNFVDHDPAFPDHLLDYECGDRTYDNASGHNHEGIDYATWPFAWYRMDHDQVEIVAVSAGTIVFKEDGQFDRSCESGGTWNAVYVQHADGSRVWYGHMKRGSLTPKEVGEVVERDEYLGVVGSSGSSTGPHLHLETYDAGGYLIDPYAGACNHLNPTSWWEEQRPYYDSAINEIMTHDLPPDFPPCPQQEVLHARNTYVAGEVVRFAAYFRDQLAGQVADYEVLLPDGSTKWSWNHSGPEPHYSRSYWYWRKTLPLNAPEGIWTYRVSYEGATYEHLFTVGDSLTSIEVPIEAAGTSPSSDRLEQNRPNPFHPEMGSTAIAFALARPGRATLRIFDAAGRSVRQVMDETLGVGEHITQWDGRNERGEETGSGIYYYRLNAGEFSKTRALVKLK